MEGYVMRVESTAWGWTSRASGYASSRNLGNVPAASRTIFIARHGAPGRSKRRVRSRAGLAGRRRKRCFKNPLIYKASGLNLVVAAIVLWNTVYLEQAVAALERQGTPVPADCLPHLSPLGWEHINLTGDYLWDLRQTTTLQRSGGVPLAYRMSRNRRLDRPLAYKIPGMVPGWPRTDFYIEVEIQTPPELVWS
jgi:hypothetical protein